MSPFKRTIATAEPFISICNKDNITVTSSVLPELQEYTSPKKNMSVEHKELGLIIHDSYQTFLNQVMKFSEMVKKHLLEQSSDSILIIFGHSMFFSALIGYHVNHEKYILNEKSSLNMMNCAISCESYNFKLARWKSFVIGSVLHLGGMITGAQVPFGV